MKKGLLYLFMSLFSVVLFTACGDDDPQPIQDGEFDGVYVLPWIWLTTISIN